MTPYYQDESVTVYAGDCLDVLRTLPDSSVDAVCTDPPYNLSDSGKRDADCFSRVLADVTLPDADEWDALLLEDGDLSRPRGGISHLHGELWPVGVSARVAVPEGAVHLQGAAVFDQEVEHTDPASQVASNADLPAVTDPEPVEDLGDYVLDLAARGDASFCDATCSCFTEPSAGVVAVTVRAVATPGRPDPFVVLGGQGWGDADVGVGDHAARQPQGSASVVTDAGAVHALVLRLDLRRRTGELDAAHGTRALHASALLRGTQLVGASAGARRLPAVLEPYAVRLVGDGADRTLTLYLPRQLAHKGKSTATGGFMGKTWDGWESPASFQRWCTAWATECFRVLKPGGHMLAFGGTRTHHRLACAIEDAGFEIRDSIVWLYASGFPKSLDVSKAIDKAAGAEREVTHYLPPKWTAGNEIYGKESREVDEKGYLKRPVTAPTTDAARRWQGWGTALKPAHEPIVVARKPLAGTVASNVQQWGTGALNIDGCRVAHASAADRASHEATVASIKARGGTMENSWKNSSDLSGANNVHTAGRWPPNVLLDPRMAAELDRQSGVLHSQDPVPFLSGVPV